MNAMNSSDDICVSDLEGLRQGYSFGNAHTECSKHFPLAGAGTVGFDLDYDYIYLFDALNTR